jgi:hypothetical protein
MRFSDAWPIDSQNFSKQAADSKFWIRKSASQPAGHRYLTVLIVQAKRRAARPPPPPPPRAARAPQQG